MKKKILVCAACASLILLCGCSGKKTPAIYKAIENKVLADNPLAESFSILSATVRDSVTLDEELSRRIRLFETKVKTEETFAARFSSKNLSAKAAPHAEAARNTREILSALDKYRKDNSERLDSVIYFVVDFEGSGKLKNGSAIEKSTMSAAVGRDLNVYKLSSKPSAIFSGMGVAIPGYKTLLESLRASE